MKARTVVNGVGRWTRTMGIWKDVYEFSFRKGRSWAKRTSQKGEGSSCVSDPMHTVSLLELSTRLTTVLGNWDAVGPDTR